MSDNLMGKDVAEEFFDTICDELGLSSDNYKDEEDGLKTRTRLVNSIMAGRLDFADGKFTLKLLSPVKKGEKVIEMLNITEPDGVQLRSMSEVKKSNDDVGKGMAVLGAVTGEGLPVINKLKSRDLMVAIEVIGLFL